MIGMVLAMMAAPATCPAERATYRLRGALGVTAGFARQRHQVNFASDLFFWLRTADGRKRWFSLNSPNGYGGTSLTPDRDATRITQADREADPPAPAADMVMIDFDVFDARYNHLDNPPQAGEPAPAHLFARGLGPLLWYNPSTAANGDPSAKAVGIPIAMYDLVGCARR